MVPNTFAALFPLAATLLLVATGCGGSDQNWRYGNTYFQKLGDGSVSSAYIQVPIDSKECFVETIEIDGETLQIDDLSQERFNEFILSSGRDVKTTTIDGGRVAFIKDEASFYDCIFPGEGGLKAEIKLRLGEFTLAFRESGKKLNFPTNDTTVIELLGQPEEIIPYESHNP